MSKPIKVESIHLLRGIAILAIVFQHCMSELEPSLKGKTGFYYLLIQNTITGLTTTFVIIAGYLFQLLNSRYSTKTYYISKIKNVVLPYLFVSLFSFMLFSPSIFDGNSTLRTISNVNYHLLNGDINHPLWFIPMIILIYMLGPIFYILSNRNITGFAICCFVILSIYQRPLPDAGPIYNAIYFFLVYIIGMAIRQNQELLFGITRKNMILFMALVLLPAFISITREYINLPWEVSTRRDQALIIFTILTLFTLSTYKISIKLKSCLSILANYSFAIYFLHLFFIRLVIYIFNMQIPFFDNLINSSKSIESVIACIMVFIPSTLVTIAFISFFKKIFGVSSRYVIGY